MDYVFEIGKRFGNLPFYINEEEIKGYLGAPDFFKKEVGVDCYTSDYKYIEFGIDISYLHFDEFDDAIQIQTNKIFLNDNDLYVLPKNEVLELIKNEYASRKIKFNYEYESYEFEDAENQEEYDFEDIGLTLWFRNQKLINASVSKPISE